MQLHLGQYLVQFHFSGKVQLDNPGYMLFFLNSISKICLKYYSRVNTIMVIQSQSVNLLTVYLGLDP